MNSLRNRIDELPGDALSLKTSYLYRVSRLANEDIDSALVLLGKAGERLAKGCLARLSLDYQENDSFDTLLRKLSAESTLTPVVVGLRTLLKYRNQAAHDTKTTLGIYDLEAAFSAFSAAYQASFLLLERGRQDGRESEDAGGEISPYIRDSKIPQADRGWNFLDRVLQNIRLINLFSIALLLWAVIRGGNYDFFLVVRVVVSVNAALLAYFYFRKTIFLFLLFLSVVVLFNPIFPFYLSREVWKIIDLGMIIIFIISLVYGSRQRHSS